MDVHNFLNLIEAKDNDVLIELKKCNNNGLKTFIYGAGEGADNIKKRFSKNIKLAGMLVDKEFQYPATNILSIEDILSREKINIIVGHRGFKESKIEKYKKNIGILINLDCFAGNYDADPCFFKRTFVEENAISLLKVYEKLQDETSKKTFIAYINQKISMNYKYLKDLYLTEDQYFLKPVIKLVENECFVNCGAYIGDTVESLIKHINNEGLNYQAIYSFEPDKNNYKKLVNKGIKKLHSYCMATSNKKTELNFSSIGKGSSSRLTSYNSAEKIVVDKLDNVLKGKKVTFIKMDIEGHELDSLKGAEYIIRKNKPKLAICIYHKKEDLWQIQEYIQSIVPSYKFYVRAYDYTATELVLYAVV